MDKEEFIKNHVLVCKRISRKSRSKSMAKKKGKFYSLYQSKRHCALSHWKNETELIKKIK